MSVELSVSAGTDLRYAAAPPYQTAAEGSGTQTSIHSEVSLMLERSAVGYGIERTIKSSWELEIRYRDRSRSRSRSRLNFSSFVTSQCNNCCSVVWAIPQVNRSSDFRSPRPPEPIKLKFDTVHYIRHSTPYAKIGGRRKRRCVWDMEEGVICIFWFLECAHSSPWEAWLNHAQYIQNMFSYGPFWPGL